ncbi:MAG: hypothetical protein U0795_09130 [Pirellulales bacterium]
MTELQQHDPERLDDLERLIREAQHYVGASPDLRPRVLESSGQIVNRHRAWRRVFVAALATALSISMFAQQLGPDTPWQLREPSGGPTTARSWRTMLPWTPSASLQ